MVKLLCHTFDSGPLGNLCSNEKTDAEGNKHPCNVNLVDILGVTKEHISKQGFNCDGSYMSQYEYDQVVAYREKLWGALDHPLSSK